MKSFAGVWGHWPLDPQILIAVVAVGALYWIGTRATLALLPPRHPRGPRWWRAGLFYLSLVLVLVALQSPLDYLSQTLMWAHMIQHLILLMAVPPLMLLGDPALPLLRGLPSAMRRRALGQVLSWRWVHGLGALVAWVARPLPTFILFGFTLYIWHWPVLYDLTLSDQGVHDLEHLTFLLAGVLFWWQVIDQTQFRCRMRYHMRAVYVFCGAGQNHLLAVTLALVTVPLYSYRHLAVRPGGISALADQQYAGGIMWVPGMFLYGTAFVIFLYKWLQSEKLAIGQSAPSDPVAVARSERRLRLVAGSGAGVAAPPDATEVTRR